MAQTTFGDLTINTNGDLPAVGSPAPDFALVTGDLQVVSLADYADQRVVLNIFPSIDTATCAQSVRTFNERAAALDNTTVLCVSQDLPFAGSRFCGAEGIENAVTASTYRHPEFLEAYGVRMVDGPLEGLAARAVVVVGEDGNVAHNQLVVELANEPDYDAALAVL